MSLEQFKTQVLLLHSQQRTLDTLSAGFSDKYSVHCATSGSEALQTLGDTPIHVIVSAQDLPGMSGLEALREAKKRSPETIGILLAGDDKSDGLEAMVGDHEVLQIVRGEVQPAELIKLIEGANRQATLMALASAANDQSANVDQGGGEHIVMETSENGATIISDGTGRFPSLRPEKIQISPGTGGRDVDVLVLTKDDEFLSTIKDSARGLHNVHHATTNSQAENFIGKNKIGVLVTDAAMKDDSVETLTARLRKQTPRLVAIVAGRRDDGEILMDLINRGHVYRFLLKPVSPGRARLAIEASVKHHLEAPDQAFKPKEGPSLFPRKDPKAEAKAKAEAEARRRAEEEAKRKAEEKARREAEEKAKAEAEARRKAEEKARREAEEKARAEAEARRKAEAEAKRKAEEDAKRKAEERRKAEAEAKRKAEEEAKRKAEEEARRKAEEEARRKAEEEARRKAEEEARRRAEEEAKRRAEEEARRKAEEEARRKAEEEARRKAEEEARRKAEEQAKAKAEAEARKKAKAEAKARAKAEAEARKKEKAEAKARARAEAEARKQAKAEARAAAKAQKIEPTISDEGFGAGIDDGLEDTFGESTSFTDTMTDIAAALGKSFSGAADNVAHGAHDLMGSLGDSEGGWLNAKSIGIGAGVLAIVAIGGWLVLGGDSAPEEPVASIPQERQAPAAAIVEEAPPARRPQATVPEPRQAGAEPGYSALLEEARAARNAGDLITPRGESAIELYAEIAPEAAGDPAFDTEFQAVVDQVLAMAEAAILARNADRADEALDMARIADPNNPRLTFLRVQVDELLLRDRADSARVAIREKRYEDAGRLIAEARSFAGGDLTEIDMLTGELASARSEQQVGATIVTANERLESGALVAPANDNARYYFQLALSNDPENLAAQQGLIAVASKLVLQARQAIDDGRLDRAESLLDDARDIDPAGKELSITAAALTTARNEIAEAGRKAERERQAAAERQAELRRQEEAQRRAEAAQQERDRVAEQQRQAAAAEDARRKAERDANAAATASPLGVGASAPRTARAEPAPAKATETRQQTTAATQRTPAPEPEPSPPPRQTTVVIPPASEPVPQQASIQRQSASAVNVQSSMTGSSPSPTGPEMVPISRLTRINYVGPEYPRAARRRNVTGSVDVAFTVTTDGRVRDLSVLKSEPGDTFDDAAMAAVEQWRFEPVLENGVAVEKRSAVRLAFSLE